MWSFRCRGAVMRGLVAAVAVSTCALTVQAQASQVPMPANTAAAGPGLGVVPASARARVVLARDTVTGDGLVAVRVRVEGRGFTVASYQGIIRFSVAGGVVVKTFTTAGTEGQNLLNLDAGTPGLLRYAGFSARGFTQPAVEVGRVVFRASSLDRLKLTASLDVMGDPEGKSVPSKQRTGATGISSPTKSR